jgi:hypothetical protein
MTPEEDYITTDEVMRRWELPGDHPDSWVQRNATYRDIWNRAILVERGRCARIAEEEADQPQKHYQMDEWHRGRRYGAQAIAAAIRSTNTETGSE